MAVLSVRVSEWAFRRLEAGQRAVILPEVLTERRVSVDDQIKFIEVGYEGRGTDSPVNTGRELVLVVRLVTVAQHGMAGGNVLVEFINDH